MAPATVVAERSEVVLAALVLFTALTIAPCELAQLRARNAEVAVLVLAPFAVLVPLAWVASRPFDGAVSDGVLALGVASAEVAAVGMVALAGGLATVAVAAIVYGALSGAGTESDLVAAAGGALFLALSAIPVAVWTRSISASFACGVGSSSACATSRWPPRSPPRRSGHRPRRSRAITVCRCS